MRKSRQGSHWNQSQGLALLRWDRSWGLSGADTHPLTSITESIYDRVEYAQLWALAIHWTSHSLCKRILNMSLCLVWKMQKWKRHAPCLQTIDDLDEERDNTGDRNTNKSWPKQKSRRAEGIMRTQRSFSLSRLSMKQYKCLLKLNSEEWAGVP